MTKYTEHKHGLIIGSDNVFSIIEDGTIKSYNSIVWTKSITFDNLNTVNTKVRSSANQIIWDEIIIDGIVEEYKLDWWINNWLEKEIGKRYIDWDIRNNIKAVSNTTIFFKKRGSALKFVNKIKELLCGERYL